jgi:hypothetical protein
LILIEFGEDLEWWTQNILYDRIANSIPATNERGRSQIAPEAGGRSRRLGQRKDIAENMRTELIEALLRGVEQVIEAMEPEGGTEEGGRKLKHLRELRETALAARS